MTPHTPPTFFELSRDESVALLLRNHVGRLAYSFHDRVDVEPISYVFAEGWIYARTSPGSKLAIVHHHPWVAFEVDEVRGRFDWKSVIVHGTIYFLEADASDKHRAEYDAAVAVLRSADADALTPGDTTPHRQALFRIHADEVTGRGARQ